ncbi:MAG: hypothetical protein ACKVX7_13025 [Planctomycetota bacterium]
MPRLGARRRRWRGSVSVLVAIVALVHAGSCAHDENWVNTAPFPDRKYAPPTTPPTIRYCFDTVGHQIGNFPFIYGGTCVCTPTPALIDAYQRDGYLLGYTAEALLAIYGQRRIATTVAHRGCNNLCDRGPHVVKGGRCLVPPTPGTLNYEEVLSGEFALTATEARKVSEHGGPLPLEPLP